METPPPSEDVKADKEPEIVPQEVDFFADSSPTVKDSIASTVKLDATVFPGDTPVTSDPAPIDQNIDPKIAKGRWIRSNSYHTDAISDDEEDKELNDQFQEFMKESEEFTAQAKEKLKAKDPAETAEDPLDLLLSDPTPPVSKPIKGGPFEQFWENPASYLAKLIKKKDPKEGWAVLEEIIMKVESIESTDFFTYK